jgi:NAD-reducing hydrogenase small subunit
MKKIRLASLWLDGCSGCHMSFLDLDFELGELFEQVELVYSPLVDVKIYPDEVDAVLIEGAVSSESAVAELLHIRKHTRTLIAFGDCAATANVPGMRNQFPLADSLARAYVENADDASAITLAGLPALLPQVRPVHEIVPVDLFLPGCPPPTGAIREALASLLGGQELFPLTSTRFGA